MADNKVVCLCKGVTEETIVNAIKNGETTVEEVKEVTGASGGPCRGARCKKTIEELIDANK